VFAQNFSDVFRRDFIRVFVPDIIRKRSAAKMQAIKKGRRLPSLIYI
jgi:hypothetical protein